jgi:excisionase family DNA binding protein
MEERRTNFLTTRQLARMWQVSEATIKRWADAGYLHSQKTIGGHRRFTLSEVLRFQSERGLRAHQEREAQAQAAHASARRSATARRNQAREQFFAAIFNGHEAEATAILLQQHLDRMPPVRILEEIVTASLHRVGDLWHGDEMSVADEHLATRTAIRAIESLRAVIRPTELDGPVAICCAVEDELHEVATLCVQVLLETEGWSVRNFGANMPFFALGETVNKHRPRLVCISSTTNIALARYAREYEQFQTLARKHRARIVLGGEGFQDETIQKRFPADLHAETLKQLLEFMKDGL